jgi:hypothetical protein
LVQAQTRLVAVAGVSGLVVVDTPDAVLIADRRDGEAVRGVVAQLGARREARDAGVALHPWGETRLVARRPGYQVRELLVDPGAVLPEAPPHRLLAGRLEPVEGGLRSVGPEPARLVVIEPDVPPA